MPAGASYFWDGAIAAWWYGVIEGAAVLAPDNRRHLRLIKHSWSAPGYAESTGPQEPEPVLLQPWEPGQRAAWAARRCLVLGQG